MITGAAFHHAFGIALFLLVDLDDKVFARADVLALPVAIAAFFTAVFMAAEQPAFWQAELLAAA